MLQDTYFLCLAIFCNTFCKCIGKNNCLTLVWRHTCTLKFKKLVFFIVSRAHREKTDKHFTLSLNFYWKKKKKRRNVFIVFIAGLCLGMQQREQQRSRWGMHVRLNTAPAFDLLKVGGQNLDNLAPAWTVCKVSNLAKVQWRGMS